MAQIRVTQADWDAVDAVVDALTWGDPTDANTCAKMADYLPTLRGLAKKLQNALRKEIAPVGMSLARAEAALAGCQKYARFAGGSPARTVKQLRDYKVTEEQLAAVGAWVDRQPWLRGTVSLRGIMNKWEDWLAKALADSRAEATYTGPAPMEDA